MGHHIVSARPRPRHRLVAVAAGLAALTAVGLASTAPAGATGLGGHGGGSKKVTICKATGDRENPYVKEDVDVDVAAHLSRNGHSGPVFSDRLGERAGWGDVIPPFEFGSGGKAHFTGKNWGDEGKTVHRDGCTCPGKKPHPKPTLPPHTKPTLPPHTKPTLPPHTRPTPPGTRPTPPTRPVTTRPGSTTTATTAVKGTSTVAPTTAAPGGSLPVTGSNSGALVVLGLVLTAAGGGLLLLRRKGLGR